MASAATYTHEFNTETFKGKVEVPLGLFINGKWVNGSEGKTIDIVNPTNGNVITSIAEGTKADVDNAYAAAREAFNTTWGLNAPATVRGRLLNKLADLMERDIDCLSALEALDNGKTFNWAKAGDLALSIDTLRHYAGWADKNMGQVIETDERKLAYTRHEPKGVVAQIIPWNFPVLMLSWKIAPALATGNTIIMKPSEFTPLTALYMTKLIAEAGFPAGVFNLVNGYGQTVGAALSEHMDIDKVAFTGSTLVGRKIMEAAARSNLKDVTLELGGKSPNIIFDDADLEAAVNWTSHGIFWNHGQTCCAGSRIFVQSKIYDEFVQRFTERARQIKLGDPFSGDTNQGPQVSQIQYDRIMEYIESGKKDGATCAYGGTRFGDEGYFINPTIFTDVKPDMKIVREEIFGPVGVIIKFETEEEVIKAANDTAYGLAAAVFSQNINRALNTAHKLHAGTAWVNCINQLHANVPFGGYKQSGIGRELGEYALANYTNVKAVHVNIGHSAP
jgi:aldehyde dehydrogenase (NAD+)